MKIKDHIFLTMMFLCGLWIAYLLFSKKENLPAEQANNNYEKQAFFPEQKNVPIKNLLNTKPTLEQGQVVLSKSAIDLANIETQKVFVNEVLEKSVRLTGKVVLDETRVKNQIAHLPGRIDKLYVTKVGQFIKKGQPIASVYSRELIAAFEVFEYSKNSSSVVRSAENNLKVWKISKEQLKDFDIKGDYQKPIDVLSDFTGVVLKKYVREGDYAVNTHMGAPTLLFEIADMSELWVLFDVYETDLGTIRQSEKVEFTVPAFPGKTFSGKIDAVEPLLNPLTKTATVRVIVKNVNGLLQPEMQATGFVFSSVPIAKEFLIPQSAVLWSGKQSVVYVKKENEKGETVFEFRKVLLGETVDRQFQVLAGLEETDEVVSKGVFVIDAEAQLTNKKSLMQVKY